MISKLGNFIDKKTILYLTLIIDFFNIKGGSDYDIKTVAAENIVVCDELVAEWNGETVGAVDALTTAFAGRQIGLVVHLFVHTRKH